MSETGVRDPRAARGRRHARSVVLLAVSALLATGCGPARAGSSSRPGASAAVVGATPGVPSIVTLEVAGRARTFRLFVPGSVRGGGPVPLVVMLHGGFGTGAQAESSYGWDAVASRERFVVAYPDGVDRAWDVGGGCCGVPARVGVDDVGFVVAMVARIARTVPLDPRRLYATGISNGGMLAYLLACRTRVFAAIGPDSATEPAPCPARPPTSVIHLHGTADHNIPYLGGPGDGVARIDGPSVPSVVAAWRAADACAPPTTTTAGVVTTSVATCPRGRSVELVTIAGAGHQWPGGSPGAVARLLGLDPPSTALSATEVIWRFFAAHPRPST